MKKLFLGAAAVAALFAMSACSGNKSCDGNACTKGMDDDMVYTGVLPAADADGVRYTLSLDYDDDHNGNDGDYHLVETYLKGDTTATAGFNDELSFKSKGDFTVEQRDGMKYIRLVPKAKKSSKATSLYFMVDSDSTLTLVNDSLEASPNTAMNYTLRLVR